MGQEYFGGPEYFQEFDPEKFARDIIAQAQQEKAAENADADDADADADDADADAAGDA